MVQRSVDPRGNCGTLSTRPRVRRKHFLEQRAEVREVGVLAKVLLGDLKLEHQGGLWHRADHGMERLARLKVERTVLDLPRHVVAKQTLKRLELVVPLLYSLGRDPAAVGQTSPHPDTATGRDPVL